MQSTEKLEPQLLTSWKEIAAYFGKGVRTVQRWEKSMGLPIHRPGEERTIVIADPDALKRWATKAHIDATDEQEPHILYGS